MTYGMAEPADLEELFTYLSDLHRTEIANFTRITGLGWQDFVNAIAAWADQSGAWVQKDRFGRVLFIWGARHWPGRTGVFLLCTRAFFDHTGTNLRRVRQILKQTRQPGEIVSVVTYSGHPKARKWAKVVGFTDVVEDMGGLRFTLAG